MSQPKHAPGSLVDPCWHCLAVFDGMCAFTIVYRAWLAKLDAVHVCHFRLTYRFQMNNVESTVYRAEHCSLFVEFDLRTIPSQPVLSGL